MAALGGGGAPYLEERPEESAALARGSDVLDALIASGQTHLVAGWGSGDPDLAAERQLKLQLASLDASVHGGVVGYVGRAKELLAKSRDGANPFDGYTPSIPTGFPLKIGEESFSRAEAAGAAASRGVAFVLVAGGLGERLGYSGMKLAMPADSLSGVCYLELYAQHILALQGLNTPPAEAGAPAGQQRPRSAKGGVRIPLVIMTSDDTDAATCDLLARHANFGLAPSQLHIVKQGKVPCLADGAASLALDPADPYALLTKPHGHGDVHALLHTSGIARRLLSQGCTHLVFLQDTNANVFGGVTAALGVSVAEDLAMNTISVPRGAGDAAGALMTLRSEARDKTVTVNVEYNQLDALVRLRAEHQQRAGLWTA
jgi:UDP-sugar pyrophosphorylase